jgi:hypothetical protein
MPARALEETTVKSLYRAMALGTLLAISYAVIAADTADPVIGTWKLNAAKSQVRAGAALAKSDTRTYTKSDGGVTFTWKRVTAEGRDITVTSTSAYDGKDFPVKGSPDIDTANAKRVDANTVETTLKRDGKVVGHSKRTVSKDGKTLTVVTKGTNANGDPFEVTLVYDRQ